MFRIITNAQSLLGRHRPPNSLNRLFAVIQRSDKLMTAYLEGDNREASRGPPVTLLLPVAVTLSILHGRDAISVRAPAAAPGSQQ
jgi:hypothetical protein